MIDRKHAALCEKCARTCKQFSFAKVLRCPEYQKKEERNGENKTGSGKSAPVDAGAGIKHEGPAQTGQQQLFCT